MKFRRTSSLFFAPDGTPPDQALARTTHLGIGAHQDDLESIAIPGILTCYQDPERWFTGVVVTDGAGAPRTGRYRSLSPEDLVRLRHQEQKEAARLGEYSGVFLLNHPSTAVKNTAPDDVIHDLQSLIRRTQPTIIYTHNPLDKHPTHVAVAIRTLQALRGLPPALHPEKLYGVEFWRGLAWLPPPWKVTFNCSQRIDLQRKLLDVFQSQNAVKDYPQAVMARRLANAVFAESHQPDREKALVYGLDLTPLLHQDHLSLPDYALSAVDELHKQFQVTFQDLI